jgi:predicted ATPase
LKTLKKLKLNPLNSEESAELFHDRWPELKDNEVRKSILSSSSGNPYFIEQYISFAKQSESSDQIPASVQNMFFGLTPWL